MKNDRLMSLDALRGFDMLFIMGFASLVVALCGLWPCGVTDAIARSMSHVSWNGLRHHDTIFPLFLFLAGVSFPFSLAKQRETGRSCTQIYVKIIRRGVLLVLCAFCSTALPRKIWQWARRHTPVRLVLLAAAMILSVAFVVASTNNAPLYGNF